MQKWWGTKFRAIRSFVMTEFQEADMKRSVTTTVGRRQLPINFDGSKWKAVRNKTQHACATAQNSPVMSVTLLICKPVTCDQPMLVLTTQNTSLDWVVYQALAYAQQVVFQATSKTSFTTRH